ncbi:helix-turn-helix transcriptional regulator [Nordella sp. HKS 07]|uniref:helix-turn-helix transcriptional regulator n=1 Tax=Nordella sp. HKS 07 TaxID=2712222 RepID=UPI0013E1D438|nr:helix-turn-helix transcriptional regulator [Nordella sp. HKS 07]
MVHDRRTTLQRKCASEGNCSRFWNKRTRTLVRRLAELGASFAQIVDRLRHDLALKYLSERDLSLTEIAFLLGYSNQSAFSSACRRWTGKTPREIRAQFILASNS